ncbi:putative helicase senataxin [Araneus ventricosus]|uniref:Putative helicase senataxin n=1 Tax=Araneus ventricosus TaxID=182803 RepID=A0A4Y2UEH5_ARAVE|nr:putative helicase senataxin [Araneus ventricosus]GBO10018.1 putative helicase senataxin [Araneus ventricosus]
MEYFLRQIEAGNPDPLIIKLKSDDVIVGSDMYPALAKYPRVLPQHAQFVRQFTKWYVKSMQSSEKIHVNGFPLVTHRLKEIQIGDHVAFGSADDQKRFVCCLSAKASCKRPEVEIIDISSDDSPATEIGSMDNDRTIKNEPSGIIIPVTECDQVEDSGERNERLVKSPIIGENVSEYICPPTVKSEHTSDCLPFKRDEPMDWNPATVESEFEYICPPTVKSVQVNDSLCSVNRDPMDKTLPAVRNDYMDNLPLLTESDPKDKSLPAAENELDYSCPPTVRNDYVPFIKGEPLDSSFPIVKNESLNNRHFIVKNERANIYSPVIKSEPMDTNPPIIKSEPKDTNPPVVKSEPMDTTYPFRKTKPVNAVPSVSNELVYNTLPAVKNEPVDSIHENSKFHSTHNFVPSASQSDAVSVNQITASSAKEKNIAAWQFQTISSSSSAINNQDFNEKLVSSLSEKANQTLVTTENFIPSSKDISSASSSQNVHVNAVSVESKDYSMNSGYSEIEDVITISDDEAYLDYGSCKTIKQEYLDDDFNINYHENSDFKASEVHDENDMHLHSLLSGDDSTLSSIIKEHEESAKKMLDDDFSSKIGHEYSSFSGNISQDLHNADMEGESSNSSVSSHEDIIIPFAKKTKSDSSNTGNRKSESGIEMTAPFSKKENRDTTSIKKPYSTFKSSSLKRTLPTEPKPLSHSTRKIRKPEEHKKDSEQMKKKIPKKSKSDSVLSGRKALAKSKNGLALSSQKVLTSSFEDKCAVSKKLRKLSNKKPQPSKESTGKNMQKSSKISNGIVVTEKLEFKIPKVRKSSSSDMNIASSASEKTNLETTHQSKGSTLDKKTPTIARKPDNWASRSGFLITDFSAEKPKPVRKISAVSKANIKANKLTNSTKMSSSADREINKTGKRTGSELNSLNVINVLKNSKMSSSADREINGPELNSSNVITGLKNSKMSSSADREINKTGKESGPQLNSPNVITGLKNSKMSSSADREINTSADREINKTRKGTGSEPNSLNVFNDIKSLPIQVIVSSNRRKDRKSLNEDRNLSKTAIKINRSISHNQALLGLLNKQFHGDEEVNFESDAMNSSDNTETPVISGNNFLLSKEQNVSKHHFPIGVASTSTKSGGNTQWQQLHKDQGLNFNSDSLHIFDKSKTPVISENNFQLNTDRIVVPKQQLPSSVASTSNYARNDIQRHNTSVFTANHHNEATKLYKNLSDRKNHIIKTVIEWSERWFKEYETMCKPHPNLTNGVLHLPLYFDSLNDYISSFIRLLLLEIWEKVSIQYKPIWTDEKRLTNKFYFIVTSVENKWDVTEYKCEALINHLSFEPKAENLVILFIQDKKTENINPIIGYIKSYEILSNNNNTNPELLSGDKSWIKDANLCQFSVFVKIRNYLSPVFNKIMKGNGLFCLSSYLKLVEASHNLEYSPLCQSILKPESSTFFSNYPDVPSTSTFSKAQMSIIQGISSEIEKQVSEPKLFLIQGAPGTGKTHIILGLLENLIFSCRSRQKILIVAPSSVAIDEIGSRLIELDERSRSWSSHVGIRFVRVNLYGKTSEKMRPFSLDEIYREYKIKSKMERLGNIERQIQTLIKSNDPSDQEDIKSLIEQREELRNQIQFILSDEKTRSNYYHYLLQASQVILTTVSCCSSPLLQEFCKRNSNLIFSCCIIDEVTQCTELEFLQVISLGINKFILVGDHHGLPAVVLSKTAENFGYGRSAFERFLQYFSRSQQENPVVQLLEQHRMHSDICYFPSYYFYNNQLTTADGIDSRYDHFLAVSGEKMLSPYTVFYIQKYGNQKLCVDSVIKLCIQSVTYKPIVSVGIIVPSRELHDAFTRWVTVLRKTNSKYEFVEVGTVENFQGQEKDIVFLCCYYDGDSSSFLSNSRKLNVALTRACKCLVLCIFSTAHGLEQDWVNLIADAKNRHCCYFITLTKEMSLILK